MLTAFWRCDCLVKWHATATADWSISSLLILYLLHELFFLKCFSFTFISDLNT